MASVSVRQYSTFHAEPQDQSMSEECGDSTPPPPCISYALVQATVGVGTVIIVYVILIAYEM